MRQVVIIGAGPSGSVAGVLLARAGWSVALIEQHVFPREKVCGECLSALGIAVLGRAGLRDRVARLKPVVLRRATLYPAEGRPVDLTLREGMWGISRGALDAALLGVAREAGAEVHQPARCESIEPGRSPAIVVRDLGTNLRETLRPDIVVLADGKGALLPERPEGTADFGIKAHFVDVAAPGDAIGLFGVRGHYGGVAPIEGGGWNVACSVPGGALRENRGDVGAVFERMLRENRHLRGQFRRARRVGAWMTSPLPRFAVAREWPAGVIPLGNAAAALEPIGGEGIGLGLRSAELAAEELIARPGRPDVEGLRRAFKGLWGMRRAACRGAARVMSWPGVAEGALNLLRAEVGLGGMALALMGKG